MRFFFILLSFFLLQSCSTWKYYVPEDPTTRRARSVQMSMGRFFSDGETSCVALRFLNYRKKVFSFNVSQIILKAGEVELKPMSSEKAVITYTFKSGMRRYFGKKANEADFYADEEIRLEPQKPRTFLVCYDIKALPDNYQLLFKGPKIDGKQLTFKPFKMRLLKKK